LPDRSAPTGSYAGVARRRGQGVGSFATGSNAGDPDLQRRGSFADVEHVVIVIYKDDKEHSRVTGYRRSGSSSAAPRSTTGPSIAR
jgi:hypothetical protein